MPSCPRIVNKLYLWNKIRDLINKLEKKKNELWNLWHLMSPCTQTNRQIKAGLLFAVNADTIYVSN